MQIPTPAELFQFANLLADEAALISCNYFRQDLNIAAKEGGSPVTIADKEVELRLRNLIHQRYPRHGIIGEEFANAEADNEYTWVLDPIDGTVAFASGKPTFTTLIAVLARDLPLLSVIDQPVLRERFSAVSGQGAWLNDKLIHSSSQSELGLARLNATTPDMFKTDYESAKFEQLRKKVKLTSFGGDAYAFGLLAAGHIDLIMEADLQYYDVAALIAIISASGGVISDWQGQPLTRQFNGQCLAAANRKLHQQALESIND